MEKTLKMAGSRPLPWRKSPKSNGAGARGSRVGAPCAKGEQVPMAKLSLEIRVKYIFRYNGVATNRSSLKDVLNVFQAEERDPRWKRSQFKGPSRERHEGRSYRVSQHVC